MAKCQSNIQGGPKGKLLYPIISNFFKTVLKTANEIRVFGKLRYQRNSVIV